MKTYEDGIQWAAQWVEDSLKGETDERVIEFGKNMAMTLRAATLGTVNETARDRGDNNRNKRCPASPSKS